MKLLSFFIAAVFCFFHLSIVEAAEGLKVAAIFSKTGKAALDNTMTLNGVRFAVEELNQQGGLLGKQIILLEFDNQILPIIVERACRKWNIAALHFMDTPQQNRQILHHRQSIQRIKWDPFGCSLFRGF